MEIRNLQEENVKQIENLLKELKQANPAIVHRIFDQDSEQDKDGIERRLGDLEAKIEKILNKITFIFGDYYMLNGKFVNHNLNGK